MKKGKHRSKNSSLEGLFSCLAKKGSWLELEGGSDKRLKDLRYEFIAELKGD